MTKTTKTTGWEVAYPLFQQLVEARLSEDESKQALEAMLNLCTGALQVVAEREATQAERSAAVGAWLDDSIDAFKAAADEAEKTDCQHGHYAAGQPHHLGCEPTCKPTGYVISDGRDELTCGSVANPAGYCCEHGLYVGPQGHFASDGTYVEPVECTCGSPSEADSRKHSYHCLRAQA
jgi:hypothetical protein